MLRRKRHYFHDGRRGTALTVRVIPRASRTELAGILEDGTLRIRVTAPPVEGKANRAVIRLLADILQVKTNQIEIVAGHNGRDKIITVTDLSPQEAESRIQTYLENRSR